MEPANKKAKLDSRFRSPQKRETMEEICKGFVPANTKKATGWAIGVFNSWRAERNQRSEEKKLTTVCEQQGLLLCLKLMFQRR